ncbi:MULTISPECIES: cytidine deaminase [Oceanimonas]|uniref:Cytidine deaminase n=1 Tax=Oceanimonas doudoroffii TaxID=84158 RepID=A0A233RHN2_9GAMM|nr:MULTISPECIES: cytidine deaminase [Oceanimonas]NHI00494.1 Cytidine deaminase [Oceanimonas sp. MB9]OXY82900.1 cytidine deaminase [Oceanimonas doudoroffii]
MTQTLAQALTQRGLARPVRLSPADLATLERATGLADDALALALLSHLQACAVTPVSGFAVGALAVAGSGHWYAGANLEFAGLPLNFSVHAEQAAIGHAALHGETHIHRMVVSASPCGHCRQFMQELNQDELTIVLPGEHHRLSALLPHAFGPADLGLAGGMLTPAPGTLTCHDRDMALQAALNEANASHAPYSNNRAGVALQLQDGRLCRGRYLENAAFNPGLGPMQLALSQLHLHGYQPRHISRAVLVESTAGISQHSAASQALASVSPVALTHVVI